MEIRAAMTSRLNPPPAVGETWRNVATGALFIVESVLDDGGANIRFAPARTRIRTQCIKSERLRNPSLYVPASRDALAAIDAEHAK